MRVALVYDFDGTLAPGHMQNSALLPRLGVKDIPAFWKNVGVLKEKRDADEVLTYLLAIIEAARASNVKLTRELMVECGADLEFFAGVLEWFDAINAFAKGVGLQLEHYVVSAGNREIIEGCPIFEKFKNVFACKYEFGADGAVWPNVAVNYTTKTQFLFRINKGIENSWNSDEINAWMPEQDRPIPFKRMIFLGDGDTDIPSFKMVREHGGSAIAVFDPDEWENSAHREKAHRLIAEGRVEFVAPGDYRDNSQLAVVVRGTLDRIARAERVHPAYFKNGALKQGAR